MKLNEFIGIATNLERAINELSETVAKAEAMERMENDLGLTDKKFCYQAFVAEDRCANGCRDVIDEIHTLHVRLARLSAMLDEEAEEYDVKSGCYYLRCGFKD